MATEILSVVVTVRVPGATPDATVRQFRRGQGLPIPVPPGTRLRAADHWPTGSTDPNWPQVRIEFGK